MKVAQLRVDILTAENVSAITDRLNGQYRLIWLFGVSTGLRISDILNLKAFQCIASKAYIKERKTGKRRAIYIRKRLRIECQEYIEKRGVSKYEKMFNVSRQSVWKAFKQAASQEGIRQNIGTHTMRKSYSAAYIRKGHNVYDLQKRLNHSHINDTVGYLTTNEQMGLDEYGRRKRKKGRAKKNG